MIEILTLRGNTSLHPILAMTSALTREIHDISFSEETDPDTLVEAINEVLVYIDGLIPFLQLAMQTSGATMNKRTTLSPSLLMKASNSIVLAKSLLTKEQPRILVKSFDIILYSLFHGSSRAKG